LHHISRYEGTAKDDFKKKAPIRQGPFFYERTTKNGRDRAAERLNAKRRKRIEAQVGHNSGIVEQPEAAIADFAPRM